MDRTLRRCNQSQTFMFHSVIGSTSAQTLLSENGGVVDGPTTDLQEHQLMSSGYQLLLQILNTTFSWWAKFGEVGLWPRVGLFVNTLQFLGFLHLCAHQVWIQSAGTSKLTEGGSGGISWKTKGGKYRADPGPACEVRDLFIYLFFLDLSLLLIKYCISI